MTNLVFGIERKIGAIAILIVSICTIILVALPRATERYISTEKKTYDHLFVWRILLFVLLTISSIVGLIGYVKFALTESIRPIRITSWVS
ncbi:uncharacterized protein LOC143214189 [Lasioglossum baleicum]|uniref:uncharacterized protein LOC143214189 n=1 Tax=Lasioglossum baleicum TaxID=434251 RepID=UPI003FCE99C5